MTFGQFVRHNVIRDKENYAAYWLSSFFTVVIFFVFSVDRYHPELSAAPAVKDMMSYAQVAILIFSLGFLTLSIFAFVRKKRQTYGTLLITGMSKGQLRRMVFLENLMTGAGAIAAGVLIGLVFGHLTVMMMAKFLHMQEISYVFPWQAVWDTVIGFLIIFAAVSLFQGVKLTRLPLRELISGKENESRNMKFHPPLAIIGIVLLAFGYLLTSYSKTPWIRSVLEKNESLFKILVPAIIFAVCVGLFLMFREFVFLFLDVIRSRSKRYLRGGNAIWISGLKDKLKSSVTTMVISTILLTIAFSSIITCISIMSSVRADITAMNPAAILYMSLEGDEEAEINAARIEKALDENGVEYQAYRYEILEYGDEEMYAIKLLRASDYNHQTGSSLTPEDGQAIDISGEKPVDSVVTVTDTDTLTITGSAAPLLEFHRRNNSYAVSDSTYDFLMASGKMSVVASYEYQADDEAQAEEVRAAAKSLMEAIDSGFGTPRLFIARIDDIDMQEYGYNILSYVALLLSLIFIVASSSLIYFRLVNDARENQPQSMNLYRFGLSVPEILKLQKRQLGALFLLPLAFAVLSTFFAMNFLVNTEGTSTRIFLRAAIILVPLILLELGYFALLNNRFEKKLRSYLSV